MHTVKVFTTHEIAGHIYQHLFISLKEHHGMLKYEVGGFVSEANRNKMKGYDQENVNEAMCADEWFIENGANLGEVILIQQT